MAISTGFMSTIAGTGIGLNGGDGFEATSTPLKQPKSVAIDSSGIYH